jgi:glycerol-3-phosphate cytidylyltransferase-like family protein
MVKLEHKKPVINRNYKLEVYQDVKLVSEAHIQTEEIYSSAQISKQNVSYI